MDHAVNLDPTCLRPGGPENGRFGHARVAVDDVEFGQPVRAFLVIQRFRLRRMVAVQSAKRLDPVIDKAMSSVLASRGHAAAALVAVDEDTANLRRYLRSFAFIRGSIKPE